MNMHWLPKNPDFPTQINALKKAVTDEAWDLSILIAQSDLNFLETLQLDKIIQEKFGGTPPPTLPTQPVLLAVLSSSTAGQLLPGIRVGGLRRNLWVSTYLTDYGQSVQELMDFSSGLHHFKPTVTLVAFDALSLF